MAQKCTLLIELSEVLVLLENYLQAAQQLLLVGKRSAGSRSHMPGSGRLASAPPKLHTQGSVGNAEV